MSNKKQTHFDEYDGTYSWYYIKENVIRFEVHLKHTHSIPRSDPEKIVKVKEWGLKLARSQFPNTTPEANMITYNSPTHITFDVHLYDKNYTRKIVNFRGQEITKSSESQNESDDCFSLTLHIVAIVVSILACGVSLFSFLYGGGIMHFGLFGIFFGLTLIFLGTLPKIERKTNHG